VLQLLCESHLASQINMVDDDSPLVLCQSESRGCVNGFEKSCQVALVALVTRISTIGLVHLHWQTGLRSC
jgi:hypothetical protein